MSQFSKQLEAHIVQRGVNYVQLARRTGIDRTLLHHLVRGDRRPSGPEQVERLADALSLSPAERKELVRLGKIARIGEEVYGRRLAVQDMLLRVSPTEPPPPEPAAERKETPLPPVCQRAVRVRALLKQLIDRECALPDGSVDFLGQPDHEFLINLLQIASAFQNVHVRQILCFDNSPRAAAENVRMFSRILPALLSVSNYEAFYYYGSLDGVHSGIAPFPILLLTSSCALQIQADYSAAILSTGPAYRLLRAHFQNALADCRPLVRRVRDLTGCLQNYQPFWEKIQRDEQEQFYYLVPEYSCTAFLDREILETALLSELPGREQLVEALAAGSVQSLKGVLEYPLTQYISREGVWSFLRTGRFSDCPDAFYHPLEPAHRTRILERSIACARESESYQLRLYDHDALPFSDALTLTASAEGQAVNINCKLRTSGYLSLSLQEPTVSAAIVDYLSSLLDTPAVASKEETLRWLEEALTAFKRS